MYKSEIYYTTIWYQWGVGEQRKRNLTSTSKTKNKTFKNSDNICRFVMCSRMCSRGSTLQSLLLAVHESCCCLHCFSCVASMALHLVLCFDIATHCYALEHGYSLPSPNPNPNTDGYSLASPPPKHTTMHIQSHRNPCITSR
jgi:hypothetical protein